MRLVYSRWRCDATSAVRMPWLTSQPRRNLIVTCAKSSNPFGDKSGAKKGGAGGGKKPSGQSKSQQGKALAKKAAPTITRPLQVTLLDDGEVSSTTAPTWDALSSDLSGEWIGQYGAYTPWEGKAEPVWVDGKNKYTEYVYTRSVEHPGAGEQGQRQLVRKLGRAPQLAQLSALPIPTEGEAVEAENIDVEGLSFNDDGVVMFEGGHYSAGPDFIGPPAFKMLQDADDEAPEGEEGRSQDGGTVSGSGEDEAAEGPSGGGGKRVEAPQTISIFEQCLVDRTAKTRVRVKATVTIGHMDNGEVDISVLRLILFKEVWAGPVGAASLDLPKTVLEPVPCVQLPRPSERQLCGEWKCMAKSAVGIEELPLLSSEADASAQGEAAGVDPHIRWEYSAIQDTQLWEMPNGQGPEEGAEGGMLWLPGGVLVSFRMLDMSGEDEEEEGEERGDGASGRPSPAPTPSKGGAATGGSKGGQAVEEEKEGPAARGFCLGLTWLYSQGRALQVERYYDEEGCLRDVRLTECVRQGAGTGTGTR